MPAHDPTQITANQRFFFGEEFQTAMAEARANGHRVVSLGEPVILSGGDAERKSSCVNCGGVMTIHALFRGGGYTGGLINGPRCSKAKPKGTAKN